MIRVSIVATVPFFLLFQIVNLKWTVRHPQPKFQRDCTQGLAPLSANKTILLAANGSVSGSLFKLKAHLLPEMYSKKETLAPGRLLLWWVYLLLRGGERDRKNMIGHTSGQATLPPSSLLDWHQLFGLVSIHRSQGGSHHTQCSEVGKNKFDLLPSASVIMQSRPRKRDRKENWSGLPVFDVL